jgi:hypothetical protein
MMQYLAITDISVADVVAFGPHATVCRAEANSWPAWAGLAVRDISRGEFVSVGPIKEDADIVCSETRFEQSRQDIMSVL